MKTFLQNVWSGIKVGAKAFGKFLKWCYAPEIVLLLASIIIGLCISEYLGAVFVVLTVLLWINDKIQGNDKGASAPAV